MRSILEKTTLLDEGCCIPRIQSRFTVTVSFAINSDDIATQFSASVLGGVSDEVSASCHSPD